MGAALVGVDGVGEGVDRLVVAGVPLHGHLDLVALALAGEVHHAGVDRLLGPVDVLDEVDKPPGVVEGPMLDLGLGGRPLSRLLLRGFRCLGSVADHLVHDVLGRDTFIGEGDGQALIQESHLLQASGHRLEVVVGGLEDPRIGPKADGGTGLFGGLALLECARHGIVVALEPLVAIATDIGFQSGRQCVDDRNADAVQAAGDLVGALLELAAGMQDRHHHVHGRLAGTVHRHRNPTTIVGDLDAAISQHPDVDLGRVACHRLIDGVVDHLPHQMVQATFPGGPDVHAGPLTDRLQPLEDLDGVGAVGGGGLLLRGRHGRAGLLDLPTGGESGRPGCFHQSTVKDGQDRFCNGVSTHLIAPCTEYRGQRCLRTLAARNRDVLVALGLLW